jgi:hypothetical protein
MKLKWLHFADVAETQEAATYELKKVQKEEFSATFQKVYDRTKVCVYANGAYFEWKGYVSSSSVFDFLKQSVLKLFDRTMNVLNSCLQHIRTKFLLLEAVAAVDICN